MGPINEVLNPSFSDQHQAFDTQFSGMTSIPFTYIDYEHTRQQLADVIHAKLTENDRRFLLSFKNGLPDWARFKIANAKYFPAVLWKQQNINTLKDNNFQKHDMMVQQLQKVLGI